MAVSIIQKTGSFFVKNRFYCKKMQILIGIYIRNTQGGERYGNQEQLYIEAETA